MKLVLLHPTLAFRDCGHCKQWQYNEQTGEVEQWRGEPLKRVGNPPCLTTTGCPKGSPNAGRELSDANWLAFAHYKQCKAVGIFPDDEIVARNAVALQDILERVDQLREYEATLQHSGRKRIS